MGAILTGVFATSAINPIFKDASGHPLPVGLIDGHPGQIVNQLIAVGITIALAVIGTTVLLKLVDLVIGLRVNEEDEIQGLDLSQHGEEGYNLDLDLTSVSVSDRSVRETIHAPASLLSEVS